MVLSVMKEGVGTTAKGKEGGGGFMGSKEKDVRSSFDPGVGGDDGNRSSVS